MKAVLAFLICPLMIATVRAAASKRGLNLGSSDYEQIDLPKYLFSPLLSWVYNYDPVPTKGESYGNLSYVPMLWGQNESAQFRTTFLSGPRYQYVLSFNEPDMTGDVGGSNLSVESAVSIWQSQLQPLANASYHIGLPSVSNSQAGAHWLDSFISQCTNCTYSFLATHFYGQTSSSLQAYLTTLHSQYPAYTIWLTEFGFPQLSTDDVVNALKESIVFLDGTDWIARYAYFPIFRRGEGNVFIGQTGAVWDEQGEITEVGKVWLGLNETPKVQGSGGNTSGSVSGSVASKSTAWCIVVVILLASPWIFW